MPRVNLSGLLAVLKDIFSQSTLIGGRFFALTGSTKDINSTNFGQLAKDNLSGLVDGKKYPCAVLLPPFKTKKNDQKGWGHYKMQIYFLVLDRRNTNSDIKNVDLQTNLSMQNYTDDWNDTNIIADEFFMAFYNYTVTGGLIGSLHEVKDTRQYHFLTAVGNDKLNGCHISVEVAIWEGENCNALVDYVNPIVVNVGDFSPNTLNKQ